MSWHLLVHYFDNVRASTAASCVGNGPESIVEIVIGVVVWNKLLGPRVKAWHARVLAEHHEAIKATLDAHHDRILASVESRLAKEKK